jgi:predicted pyridoxine 5'-phosphate oxidase superfamily flavin-nucleotide-binding protein
MNGCPANALGLTISGGIDAQPSIRRGSLADVESIDPARLWTEEARTIRPRNASGPRFREARRRGRSCVYT